MFEQEEISQSGYGAFSVIIAIKIATVKESEGSTEHEKFVKKTPGESFLSNAQQSNKRKHDDRFRDEKKKIKILNMIDLRIHSTTTPTPKSQDLLLLFSTFMKDQT